MRIRVCVVAAAVSLVLWQVPAVAADPAVAREQLKRGYMLAQEGKCDEALSHLTESLRLDPKPITLINLADCEEKVGKLTAAMGHWVDARARAQAEGLRPIEEEAAARATALEPRLARLTIALAPTVPNDAVVERDGVVLGPPSIGIPLPVDPGAHSLVVRAPGHADATTVIELAEGQSKRLELSAGAAVADGAPRQPREGESPHGQTPSPLVFVGFGAAAVGAAVGSITGLMALGAGSEAKTACPDLRCSRGELDDVEAGRTLGTVSTIAFVVAGAGAAVGVYGLLAGSGSSATPKTGANVAVGVGPASVLLRGRF